MANIKDDSNDPLRNIDTILMGERLRISREAKGYTADEVSEKIKREAEYVFQLERGVNAPSLRTLVSLARLYDVGLDYLMQTGKEDPLYNLDSERQQFLHRIAKMSKKKFDLAKKIIDDIEYS